MTPATLGVSLGVGSVIRRLSVGTRALVFGLRSLYLVLCSGRFRSGQYSAAPTKQRPKNKDQKPRTKHKELSTSYRFLTSRCTACASKPVFRSRLARAFTITPEG